jgi:hypothetical protein
MGADRDHGRGEADEAEKRAFHEGADNLEFGIGNSESGIRSRMTNC